MNHEASGVLYGVGVGPGDPDLLTLRAVECLRRADIILAAASPRNEHSLALSIARPHLRDDANVLRLDFPMTRDKATLREAWSKNAALTANELRAGKNAVFLTLGDPLIYSTFGYLLRAVRTLMPGVRVDIVPGVTSFQAAAAATQSILCEGEESLHILPGILDKNALGEHLDKNGNAVILKAYRNFPAIRACLEEHGRDDALLVSRLGLEGERIRPLRALHEAGEAGEAAETPPYLSLVLAGRKR